MTSRERRVGWASVALWGVLLATVGLIVLLAVMKKPKEQLEEPPEKAVPVRTLVIALQAMEDVVKLPGRIAPEVEADLAPERGGRIVELPIDKGQRVASGQVVLRLDAALPEAQLRRAEIESRQAEKDLERWSELTKSGAVSATELDGVQRRRDLSEVALVEARTFLEKSEVRSPVAGVIDRRYVEEGEYVNEGVPALKVVKTDRVKAVFGVPERDILAVAAGVEMPFTIGAYPDRVFTGRVSFVSAMGDPASNAFTTELLVENAAGLLRPGMIAEVSLVRAVNADAVVVPLAAVAPRKGEHIVFVYAAGRAERRRVWISSIVGREAVIASGLEPGDELVVEGHRGLQDGMLVTKVE